ncbi:MAG: hypothetical protein EOO94_03765, partial [Pedobacter sp.]
MEKNRKLPGKVSSMLLPALSLSVLFSCSKQDLQQPTSSQDLSSSALTTTTSTLALSGNILHRENFEGSTAFAGLNTQFEASHTFAFATSPVFQGKKSGRFELRDTDPENNGGTRAEAVFPVITNLNRWYSFAVYFPSADFKPDSEDELIGQWKQHERKTSSAISLRIKEDRFRLTVIPVYMQASEKIDLGPVVKDKWLSFVFHIKHSSGTDGVLELWIDGKKVVSRNGSNMYKPGVEPNMTNPEWKVGIYKSGWNGTQTSLTSKRVLYYDDIKVGSENATYSEMLPGSDGTTTVPTPTPPPTPTTPTSPVPTTPTVPTVPTIPTTPSAVTSFTLVSAHTEKDIRTITEGLAISLATIDVDKLNIRANIAAGYQSVKFELSGMKTKSFIDSNFPYSLHGDDGASNYYFDTWNPPALGKYTLKATPYT